MRLKSRASQHTSEGKDLWLFNTGKWFKLSQTHREADQVANPSWNPLHMTTAAHEHGESWPPWSLKWLGKQQLNTKKAFDEMIHQCTTNQENKRTFCCLQSYLCYHCLFAHVAWPRTKRLQCQVGPQWGNLGELSALWTHFSGIPILLLTANLDSAHWFLPDHLLMEDWLYLQSTYIPDFVRPKSHVAQLHPRRMHSYAAIWASPTTQGIFRFWRKFPCHFSILTGSNSFSAATKQFWIRR